MYSYAVVSFELVINIDQNRGGPPAPHYLIEGDSVQNFFRIMKSGLTIFTYNITLIVEALTELSG